MADLMPDYKLEIQRLKRTRASLLHNIEGYKLEILEVESRKVKARENHASTIKAIAECDKKLRGLIDTHGDVEINMFEDGKS